MPIERSAGAVIFRKEGGKRFYLLLNYPGGVRKQKSYWDFPKGHIEKGETESKAMRREVFEETGIKHLELVPKFREVIKYFFKWQGETIIKTVVFYLGETGEKKVKISDEHTGYLWLPYKEAVEKSTFKNAKEIIKKTEEFLLKQGM